MSTITGIFIPFLDGQYTSTNIITQIDSNELYVNYYPLQALNPADSNISGDLEDIFVLAESANKRYYSQKSTATQNLLDLPVIKEAKLKELDIIYANSQDCIIITGETDSNNNLPIIGKIIMRSDSSGGQLDLFARQQNLAELYGVSFIQIDGCKLENDIYVKTGIIYAGYFLREEWKKFYADILNKSSKNYITRGKLKDSINSSPDIATLEYIASTFSSYFTVPFIIDLTTNINRVPTDITQGDLIFVENLQSNLQNIESRINAIMLALN